MLDIKLIREKPKEVEKNLKKRNDDEYIKKLHELIKVDKERLSTMQKADKLKKKRNELTKEISDLKSKSKPIDKKLKEVKEIPKKIKDYDTKLKNLNESYASLLLQLPNLVHDSVPVGECEEDNVKIRKWGKPPQFNFEPKSHLEILERLDMIDTEAGSKIAGAGFFFLKGDVVLLDLALQRFAIDILRKRGFILIEPPFIVNKKTYEAMMGDLSDFAEASYKIENEELYLIPTTEYPLGSMHMGKIINKDKLPIKLVGFSTNFRKEVGTHGKYAKGLFRMHQFNKVEQYVLCLPEESENILEELQKNTEDIFQKLGLYYRVVDVCTGDIGTKANRQYDTEVWMADKKFREVGSNSNCTDYQARRMKTKFREKEGLPASGFVHTLNNTAIATSRTMIAIIEQFQQHDGSVLIPEVLQPYMNGIKKLEKNRG